MASDQNMSRTCRNCKHFASKEQVLGEVAKESEYHDISDSDRKEARAMMDEDGIVGLCYEGGIFGVTPMHWTQDVYNADKIMSGDDCCGWKPRLIDQSAGVER